MAETLAAAAGGPVDVFGHSYGGRCALGAALLTDSIRRVISYEGAPTPPGSSYHPPGIEDRLRERLAAGDNDGALATFLSEVVGMGAIDLAAYQADPIWPVRAAAAGTILRELEAEADPAASLDRLGAVRQPVLQLLGGESLPVFRDATVRARRAAGRRPHRRHRWRPPRGPPHASGSGRPGGPGVPGLTGDAPSPAGHPCENLPMLEMNFIGWIVVGFIAGAISGALVGGKTARGCLPNIVIGIIGGLIGGWLATQLGFSQVQGFIAAVLVAVFGSIIVRLILNAMSRR